MTKQRKKISLTSRVKIGLLAAASAFLVLFRHGYVFGSGDQSETLPYAKWLTNNALYPYDFYIQSIVSRFPNERWVFAKCLSLGIDFLPWLTFGLFFAATFALMLGLYTLAQHQRFTEGWRWLAVLATVVPLYNYNLGGNEVYYNYLIPSYVAQVLGVWSLVFFLKNSVWKTYVLLILATFFHPLIGVQMSFLTSLALLFEVMKNRAFAQLMPMLVYALTAGVYVVFIQKGHQSGGDSNVFDVLEFRAAHHYFPQYFGWKNWVLATPIILYGLFSAPERLRFWAGLAALGCGVYALNGAFFRLEAPLSTQWFATTIWLKTFGILGVIGMIRQKTALYFPKINAFLEKNLARFILSIGLVSAVLMAFNVSFSSQKPYDFPWKTPTDSEIDIATQAKKATPATAVFLVPPDVSAFRFWSERSAFVDFKAIAHSQKSLAEWYQRAQKVYGIHIENRRRGDNLVALGRANFEKTASEDILQMAKNQGITHILAHQSAIWPFPKIAENAEFVVYAMPQ